jgi:hypothetical protein
MTIVFADGLQMRLQMTGIPKETVICIELQSNVSRKDWWSGNNAFLSVYQVTRQYSSLLVTVPAPLCSSVRQIWARMQPV